ncbi:hypothetical protein DSL72_008824 [Monilinia vaccinii-corymbosi]|uniref:mRNA export factor GLE1 n=1 Tax=Monilinia vaccinii-corymbosi TaxID=61207 RepID=A0A8A3PS87_9HELO|nr:hypothetical protein DSL72_008824 [Monilinia vaccinii-corymbosi]
MASGQSSHPQDEAVRGSYSFIPVPSVYEHDTRFDNRNAEEVHHEILEAARLEHERVRNEAVRIFQLTLIQEHQLRAQNEIRAEEERLRIEEVRLKIEEDRVKTERQTAMAELKRRELEEEARKIPVVPPKPPTPPPAAAPAPPQMPLNLQTRHNVSGGMGTNKPAQQANNLSQTNGFSNTQQQPPKQPFAKPATPQQQQPSGAWQSSSPSQDHLIPGVERYLEIHQNLKGLRKYLIEEGKRNVPFKKLLGDYRRAIRQACGQLTGEKGANKKSLIKIIDLLKETIFTVQSPGVDPSNYMASKPNPVEGAMNNGDQLPSLFIYVLNFFSKSIVAQFTTEASVRPETAGPVGIIAVQIFTTPEFLWRGNSLIDILMAKMRVSIPTVFGIRGSEKTEEGRARIGWQRLGDGTWIDEQSHTNRQVGLAAGYASIALRDYSKTKTQIKNPWPSTYYWRAIASIVSTPPEEVSPTQFTVLKSMIEGWEQRFIDLYGIQAIAALRVALVDFPSRAPPALIVPAHSLSVLVDKLDRDMGLRLAY